MHRACIFAILWDTCMLLHGVLFAFTLLDAVLQRIPGVK